MVRHPDLQQDENENASHVTELHGTARCASCQEEDKQCTVQPGYPCCALCAATLSECRITRTVIRTLSMSRFSWDEVISGLPDSHHYGNVDSRRSPRRSPPSLISVLPLRATDSPFPRSSLEAERSECSAHQTQSNGKRLATVAAGSDNAQRHGGANLHFPGTLPQRLYHFPIGFPTMDIFPGLGVPWHVHQASNNRAPSSSHLARTDNFGDPHIKKRARRGPLDTETRVKARTVRSIGACWMCRIDKKPCDTASPCGSCTRRKQSSMSLYTNSSLCHRGSMLTMLDWMIPKPLLNIPMNEQPNETAFDPDHAQMLRSNLEWMTFRTLIDRPTTQNLVDNAVQINDVATPTLHHALHALLTSTEILRTQQQAQSDTDTPTFPSLEASDHHYRQQLMYQLKAIFDGLEHFLFTTAVDTGPTVCVAIAILFLVTTVLRSSSNTNGMPMLMEAGAERVLQTLFGLFAATHRKIGILDVLQRFSGRELISSFGEPSPDIIEALHELLWRHSSPPMLEATASPGPSESPNQLSVTSVPLDGAQANSEEFHVRSRPHEFFVAGRVFIQMLTWQPGSLDTNFQIRSRAYTEFRRFVIVRNRSTEQYSLCLPITTYGGRGVAKTGVDPTIHAVIHTSVQPPPLLEREPPMHWLPIRVVAKSPEEKLAPISRVNLGKICSIEWDTKVKEIGKVDKDRLPTLISDWKAVMSS